MTIQLHPQCLLGIQCILRNWTIFIFNQVGETEVNVDEHSVQLAAHETLKIEKKSGVTSMNFPKKKHKSCYIIELIQR